VGSGAEALLGPVLRCLRTKRALVPIPAFSEYRRVCAQQEIEFVPFPLDRSASFGVPVETLCDRIRMEGCDTVILNNPHNPSGSLLNADKVLCVLNAATSSGVTVLLDEAFIDYAPLETHAPTAAERSGLVVLRSLTKFYGCPALRVGYTVANPETTRRIVSHLPTWPVTQLAIDALAEAVGDSEYARTSLRENAVERERLSEALGELGLVVFPSAANYLLLELNSSMQAASDLRAQLIARYRIVIRDCGSYEGLASGRYVRVAVRTAAENNRLIQALSEMPGASTVAAALPL
jgi:threonine-phosphate decarboxylase